MPRSPILIASGLIVIVNLGCSPAERSESGEIESAGSVDAFALRVGDCYDDQMFSSDGFSEVSDVPGVPCSVAHDNEVYATFDLSGSEFPGDDEVVELADEGCLDRFEGAIGATYEESVLLITTLYPTRASWTQAEDREVICGAYHMELEKLTGSVLNSGM